MQPTHARWEQISNSSGASRPPPDLTSDSERETDEVPSTETLFSNISQALARNFLIADTYFVSPSLPSLGYPGPDEEVLDIGPGGLMRVPEDVLVELPDRCRLAFEEARREEMKWKAAWGREEADRARANLHICYNT